MSGLFGSLFMQPLYGMAGLSRDQDGVDPVVATALFVLAAVFRLWQYNKFKYNVISLNLLTDQERLI